MFLPEGAGDFIRSLPAAVVTTVFASCLCRLLLLPFLSSRILSPHHNPEGNWFLTWTEEDLLAVLIAVYCTVPLPILSITLLIALVIFVGSLMLVPVVGFSVFPASEKPMFLVNIETPLGTSLATTDNGALCETGDQKRSGPEELCHNVGHGNPDLLQCHSSERSQ